MIKKFLLKLYILYLKCFYIGKDTDICDVYYGQTC